METSEWWMALGVAGLFGSFIGSFLNVCVHRLARNESVVQPGSRCYSCGTHVQWYDNLPVISYLLLRGRCRWCQTSYSPRYVCAEVAVGLMTAASVWWCLTFYDLVYFGARENELVRQAPWLFMNWLSFATPLVENGVLGYGAMIAAVLTLMYYLYVSSLIDVEHRIIPDELTKGFQFLAPLLATFIPVIAHVRWQDNAFSVLAVPGLDDVFTFCVWLCVVLVGIVACIPCARFIFTRVVVEPERWQPADHKAFRTGVWVFLASMLASLLVLVVVSTMRVSVDMQVAQWLFCMSYMDALMGSCAGWLLPYIVCVFGSALFKRGAMGYGDVKFLAPIGAFVGVLGIVEVFFLAAIYGTIVGVPLRVFGKDNRIPFGPFLALAAVTTLLWGPQIGHILMPYLSP